MDYDDEPRRGSQVGEPGGVIQNLKQVSDELDKGFELMDMLSQRLEPLLKPSETTMDANKLSIAGDMVASGSIVMSPSDITQQIQRLKGRVAEINSRLNSLKIRVDL